MTCAGPVSWFGFAQAIFERAGELLGVKAPELVPIHSAEYAVAAKRPRNSVLSNARLHARFGIELTSWQTALEEVMGRMRAE
jgi:dTDP-4-dehydrorhamnose reductase